MIISALQLNLYDVRHLLISSVDRFYDRLVAGLRCWLVDEIELSGKQLSNVVN